MKTTRSSCIWNRRGLCIFRVVDMNCVAYEVRLLGRLIYEADTFGGCRRFCYALQNPKPW